MRGAKLEEIEIYGLFLQFEASAASFASRRKECTILAIIPRTIALLLARPSRVASRRRSACLLLPPRSPARAAQTAVRRSKQHPPAHLPTSPGRFRMLPRPPAVRPLVQRAPAFWHRLQRLGTVHRRGMLERKPAVRTPHRSRRYGEDPSCPRRWLPIQNLSLTGGHQRRGSA
jgi:hypothetical protein